jgi:hypothetical protein
VTVYPVTATVDAEGFQWTVALPFATSQVRLVGVPMLLVTETARTAEPASRIAALTAAITLCAPITANAFFVMSYWGVAADEVPGPNRLKGASAS